MPEQVIELLSEAARRGDPKADDAVARMGDQAWAVNALLRRMTRNDGPLPPGVPLEIEHLLRSGLPAFADLRRIRNAQAFAEKNLLAVTVSLFCASLPASYTSAAGARVLAHTGRLQTDSDRRVNETAQFVLDVLAVHGLEPSGRGRIAIGKVRLVHAAVRRSIGGRVAHPINQQQMVGTLGLFSILVLESMERLGVSIDGRDAEDFVHLWRVVGALIGVEPALLPASRSAATTLFRAAHKLQRESSEEGRLLMAELLAGMERHMPPGPAQWLPRYLVHYLLGAETADVLGCPAVPEAKKSLVRSALAATRSSALAPLASGLVARRLLEATTLWKLKGERAQFEMPSPVRAS